MHAYVSIFTGVSPTHIPGAVFILTLVIILALATAYPSPNHLSHWVLDHKEAVHIVLGGGGVAMDLLNLATK
jgi:hypothetical protein